VERSLGSIADAYAKLARLCDRCGKATLLNEAHTGEAGRVELQTGVDGVARRPVRRTVLRAG
jgi:hypothetical protein